MMSNGLVNAFVRCASQRAPLRLRLLAPFDADRALPPERLNQLDRLYQRVVAALGQLVEGP